MSETTTSLLNRFFALPRAIQWALIAAAGIVLFFAWDSYINPLADDVSRRCEQIEERVREVRSSRDVADALSKRDMEALVTSLGPVQAPRGESAGSAAFTTVVNDLLKKHGITDQSFDLRPRGNLPKNALVEILHGKRAERLTADLKFSAKPDVAMAILADIESSADIEQVANVRMTKDQNGKVKAHFVLEAWVTSSESGKTGAIMASASGGSS